MKRVAVLRGGPSKEYEVSMKTGAAVLESLSGADYLYKDIVVTKAGDWLEAGFSRNPEKALDAVDVVFVALHGSYGEDGQVQRILQRLKIPFTGSSSFSSAVAFNKELAKETIKKLGISTPKHRRVSKDSLYNLGSEIDYITQVMGEEFIVKPVACGSSLGVRYVPSREFLKDALTELLLEYDTVMVEEYIRGREATVGVIEKLRGSDMYVLPPIEIAPPGGVPVFSTTVKYSGEATLLCPGRFSFEEKAKLAEAAASVHRALHLEQYSRSDFIVRNGQVYFLEVNSLPGLTAQSLIPKAAEAIGLSHGALIEHLIETAKV